MTDEGMSNGRETALHVEPETCLVSDTGLGRFGTVAAFVKNVVMGAGYVGILSVELHFPEAGSLKGKRKHVKSAKAQLQNRFGVSVAEVDHHELWQRARLTVACVAREHNEAEQLLEQAVRYLNGQEYELVRAEKQVVAPDA